jgi:hypothetical protein
MVKWYSAATPEEQERILAAWVDAPIGNKELCQMLLDVAREQVLAYAPAPDPHLPGDPVPDPPARYVLAQLQQVRNLYNAGRAAGDGEVGADGFTFRPFPLDRTIKAIIRPIDGKPRVR